MHNSVMTHKLHYLALLAAVVLLAACNNKQSTNSSTSGKSASILPCRFPKSLFNHFCLMAPIESYSL